MHSSIQGENSCDRVEMFVRNRGKFEIKSFEIGREN